MNTVEFIKHLCKERNIPISRLERDCGFSNGYIGQLKKGTLPNDRLKKIADYFGVTVDYLMTGEEKREEKIIPTNYDVARELTATLDQLSSDNTLMFNGLKLTEEGRLLLKNSIETAIENARIISERKKKD